MIKRLKQWWKNFEYWRWPPKRKTADKRPVGIKTTGLFPTLVMDRGMETETLIKENTDKKIPLCTCSSCTQGAELPPAQQGLHEVEIDPNTLTLEEIGNRIKFTGPIDTESDGDDRVSVAVSIKIPPSSNHPLYDRYAYEFEKSMWKLVVKCLELSEKFKRDDLAIGAFTIEATLFLRGENANNVDGEDYGFPHNYPNPSAGNSGLFTDIPDAGFGSRRPHWLNEALKPLEAEKPPTVIKDFPMEDAFPEDE